MLIGHFNGIMCIYWLIEMRLAFPVGSEEPMICEAGFYQDETRQPDCKECPAGYYCDPNIGPISNYTNYPCDPGYFCLNGTRSAFEHPCPLGTFNNGSTLAAEDECQSCLGKFR